MSSLKSSGDGLPAFENESSADCNPYAYPYFHCNGTSPLIYELVVQFARRWNELSDMHNDVEMARTQLKALVLEIQQSCRQQPMQASWRDSCGDTALHRLVQVARFPACLDTESAIDFAKLLTSVAEALVEAHDSTHSASSAARALNNWKETPLHQFCAHCSFPNNIIVGNNGDIRALEHVENPMLELLKLLSRDGACSLRNCWGSYPLHDACGLPGWEPSVVSDSDFVWNQNIASGPFLEWMRQQHELMIEFLISQNTKAVGLRVEDGQTPLRRAFESLKCSPNVIQMLLSHLDEHSKNSARSSTCLATMALWEHYEQVPSTLLALDPREQVDQLGILWEATVLVLQKVSCRQDGGLVHATVTASDETIFCPLKVVQLAARLYHHELLEQDANGNTPLSLAIHNTCSDDIVLALLSENTRAASVLDGSGRFPLHLAIDKGTSYSFQNVLLQLFAAEPAAVPTRDPITGLFSFALAASLQTTTQGDDEDEQVSTIYQLLRIDPSVL